ncbi:MAG: replication-associated recombination protein A [Syntrophomonadaceae bacterium]|nr:replication-associated recombination protein A [Syntrophomonadaceae bacterium]
MDLFDLSHADDTSLYAPLAFRMRPKKLDEIIGQQHIVGPDTLLRKALELDRLHSFILYGPPGTGKTSIARIIASITDSKFEPLAAVTAGVSDIRKIAKDAGERLKFYRQKTILFVDEIHRFNKSQQDVLLPFVEDGTLILIGATTENPLYELNNALLSRLKLYVLESLNDANIKEVVTRALQDKEQGLGKINVSITPEGLQEIVTAVKGDARMALNIIDTIVNSYRDGDLPLIISGDLLKKVIGKPMLKYDRTGDYHYDTISAFIKSIRGSDPQAALFWLATMLEGGEDPKFIARRLVIHAAEDIGLADPNALLIANAAAAAIQFIGLPEGRIPLAEATIYLATAPKSNSSKTAIDQAIAAVRQSSNFSVPPHLADSSHSGVEKLGKGRGYKYPPDFGGYVEQQYLPDHLERAKFYEPGDKGYEKIIRGFLNSLKSK